MNRSRWGFVGVIVTIAAILFFIGIMIAAVRRQRQSSDRVMCQSYLRALGSAMLLYANENKGASPRTRATRQPGALPVWGTGAQASDPFADDGPQPNDVSAAIFLILRTQDITSECFTCPATDAKKDDFGGRFSSSATRSNFTDVRRNLSYSIQNPYESETEVEPNLGSITIASPEFAIASDINPGTAGANDDVLGVTSTSSPRDMKRANSNNHGKAGQNVLYADGHVSFQLNPFVGVTGDNIFTARDRQASSSLRYLVVAPRSDHNDSILLPTDD